MHHNQSEFQRQGTSGFRRFIEASNASFSLSWDFRSEFFKLLTKSPLQGSSPNLCLSIRVTCICFLELMLRNGKITARVWKDENSIGTQHTWIMTTFSHLQTFLVHLQVQFLHLSKCSRLESGQSHLIQGSQMQTKMLKLYFGWQDWCTTPRSCRRCIMMYIYIYYICVSVEKPMFSPRVSTRCSPGPPGNVVAQTSVECAKSYRKCASSNQPCHDLSVSNLWNLWFLSFFLHNPPQHPECSKALQ